MTPLKDIRIEDLKAEPSTDALIAKWCLGCSIRKPGKQWQCGCRDGSHDEEFYAVLKAYTNDWNAMREVVE